MLRAAIVGLGWWGKNLVTSVQGKTDAIRFTACCTRSRGKAVEFCSEHCIALADDYAARARRSEHRCGRAGDAAERAC